MSVVGRSIYSVKVASLCLFVCLVFIVPPPPPPPCMFYCWYFCIFVRIVVLPYFSLSTCKRLYLFCRKITVTKNWPEPTKTTTTTKKLLACVIDRTTENHVPEIKTDLDCLFFICWLICLYICLFCLFLSVPRLNPWGVPTICGKGMMCNRFPTLAHIVVRIPVVLSSILAVLHITMSKTTTTTKTTYSCALLWRENCWDWGQLIQKLWIVTQHLALAPAFFLDSTQHQ